MNLAPRYWLSAILLAVLAFLPLSASAGMTPEEVKAFESVKAKAEKGDVDAQYNLGNYYREGIGVARDFPKAVSWFRKPAELGDARAQYSLGNCYITHPLPPFGGVECFEEEVKFSRIVEKYPRVKVSPEDRRRKVYPIMNGEYELGPVEYFEPIILEYAQEVRAAGVKWYQKAAEGGYAEAQFKLGNRYYNGEGLVKDFVQAASWYRKAADQGHASAQNNLGNSYLDGKGVVQDYVQAVSWYRKAAEQGHTEAQFSLGVCYGKGRGVAKDEVEAYALLSLVSITDEVTRKFLAENEKILPIDVIQLGKTRAKQLQEEINAKMAVKKAEDDKKASK